MRMPRQTPAREAEARPQPAGGRSGRPREAHAAEVKRLEFVQQFADRTGEIPRRQYRRADRCADRANHAKYQAEVDLANQRVSSVPSGRSYSPSGSGMVGDGPRAHAQGVPATRGRDQRVLRQCDLRGRRGAPERHASSTSRKRPISRRFSDAAPSLRRNSRSRRQRTRRSACWPSSEHDPRHCPAQQGRVPA